MAGIPWRIVGADQREAGGPGGTAAGRDQNRLVAGLDGGRDQLAGAVAARPLRAALAHGEAEQGRRGSLAAVGDRQADLLQPLRRRFQAGADLAPHRGCGQRAHVLVRRDEDVDRLRAAAPLVCRSHREGW